MAERISETNFVEKVKQAEGLVLLEFYSDSCIPCKRMSPVLSEIEEEYAGTVSVYKANVNFEEKLTEEYQVMSAPTLILFRSGKELDRKNGIQKKSELTKWLDEKGAGK